MERKFNIWRGGAEKGDYKTYSIKLEQGMVVLDAIHRIQVEHSNDLAVRWNDYSSVCFSADFKNRC